MDSSWAGEPWKLLLEHRRSVWFGAAKPQAAGYLHSAEGRVILELP